MEKQGEYILDRGKGDRYGEMHKRAPALIDPNSCTFCGQMHKWREQRFASIMRRTWSSPLMEFQFAEAQYSFLGPGQAH